MKRSISSKTILVHFRDKDGKVFEKDRWPLRLWNEFNADARARGLTRDDNLARVLQLAFRANQSLTQEAA